MSKYKMFIDGVWCDSSSDESFESINPATLELIGEFPVATRDDVSSAVDAAASSFEDWSDVPAPKRAMILYRAARMLEDRKEKLARELVEEMGKVLSEARGDVQEAIDITYYVAGEGRRMFGITTPSELPDKFCMTIHRPIGVMGLITPWNFPIAIPAWKIMPALVAGNTVVFKPASDTPLLAVKLVEILERAGLPGGVLNLVFGSGSTVGDAIVRHRDIRAVSFTGSVEVGRSIAATCGAAGRRVSLELGGKNPIIVMDDANLQLATDGVLWGAFGTSGQRCTAASRVIVHRNIADRFKKMLVERTARLTMGNGLNPDVDVGPIINRSQLEKIERYCRIGEREGATLEIGGHIAHPLAGYFFEPTVFSGVQPEDTIAQEEIFGPVVAIIEAESLKHAVEIANNTEYGLSSAIYTDNMKSAFYAVEHIEAGLTYVNSSTIGSEAHLPFGGVKATGNGFREAGHVAVEEFTEVKTVYFDYSGRLQKAQIEV
jgi:aldehyde dehydrogenase (NAD+)